MASCKIVLLRIRIDCVLNPTPPAMMMHTYSGAVCNMCACVCVYGSAKAASSSAAFTDDLLLLLLHTREDALSPSWAHPVRRARARPPPRQQQRRRRQPRPVRGRNKIPLDSSFPRCLLSPLFQCPCYERTSTRDERRRELRVTREQFDSF
jgi:hypothetical protein